MFNISTLKHCYDYIVMFYAGNRGINALFCYLLLLHMHLLEKKEKEKEKIQYITIMRKCIQFEIGFFSINFSLLVLVLQVY